MHQVSAKRGKALTAAQADTLLGMAEDLVQAMSTGSTR
jgi:hypothetical protein